MGTGTGLFLLWENAMGFKDGASFCYCANVLRSTQCMVARAWSNLLAQNDEFHNATKRATKLEK